MQWFAWELGNTTVFCNCEHGKLVLIADREAQRTPELPKRHWRSHQEMEHILCGCTGIASEGLQQAQEKCLCLLLPGSQCRTQSPSIATCAEGNCGVFLKEQFLSIITSEPGKATEHNLLSKKQQHQNKLHYLVLSLSLAHKNRYVQGLDAQTFLSIPPETSLWYSSCRNSWFFSHPAHINRDRKFIALIQRQILKLCMV